MTDHKLRHRLAAQVQRALRDIPDQLPIKGLLGGDHLAGLFARVDHRLFQLMPVAAVII